ncbi:hypothetical protein KVR01_010872 [Diaporthe batatas]|uniref:uncharacterized protein n=1 Tax=Diaporthe batatas TaxID=748121 RepID=UPI001D042F1B|nr:uncharacterized protein KVR01_010872 [Diaporthe batatas]KAG8159211.1 hypothetical protein KVR01_010872 [Diaporthe batatas]
MLCKSLTALAAASLASAATPSGFEPASTTELIVTYNGVQAQSGSVVARDGTASEPKLATTQRLNGTSYAVLMIDLDIPTNNPPQTNTLLHWMQTDLTPATAATALNTSAGNANAFALQTGQTTAFATYLQPNPPARVPLSHRYTQILVDTTGVQQTALDSLKSAAQNRQGFKAQEVLTAAGLQNKVVAGNFYNVTNAGPAANSNSSSSGGSGSGSSSGGGESSGSNSGSNGASGSGSRGGNGTGAGTGSGSNTGSNGTRPGTTTNGAVVQESKSMTALVLLVVATLFLGV